LHASQTREDGLVILGQLQQHGDQVTMSLAGKEGGQIFSGRLGHRGEREKG
jgi:hypothetical protein